MLRHGGADVSRDTAIPVWSDGIRWIEKKEADGKGNGKGNGTLRVYFYLGGGMVATAAPTTHCPPTQQPGGMRSYWYVEGGVLAATCGARLRPVSRVKFLGQALFGRGNNGRVVHTE